MDYFAGLDISMDETHVWVLDREGEVVRESKTVSTTQAIAAELVKAPSLYSDRIRDRSNDADPISWVARARISRGLRREPAGLSGAQVAFYPQDRSQRRSGTGAFGPSLRSRLNLSPPRATGSTCRAASRKGRVCEG